MKYLLIFLFGIGLYFFVEFFFGDHFNDNDSTLQPPQIMLRDDSILKRLGVGSGDHILEINSVKINNFHLIEKITKEQGNKPLNIEILKPSGEKISIGVPSQHSGETYNLQSLGIDDPQFSVLKIKNNTLAQKLGIQIDDKIILIQGAPITSGLNFVNITSNIIADKKINVFVIRANKVIQLESDQVHDLNILKSDSHSLAEFLGYESHLVQKSKLNFLKKFFN